MKIALKINKKSKKIIKNVVDKTMFVLIKN